MYVIFFNESRVNPVLCLFLIRILTTYFSYCLWRLKNFFISLGVIYLSYFYTVFAHVLIAQITAFNGVIQRLIWLLDWFCLKYWKLKSLSWYQAYFMVLLQLHLYLTSSSRRQLPTLVRLKRSTTFVRWSSKKNCSFFKKKRRRSKLILLRKETKIETLC